MPRSTSFRTPRRVPFVLVLLAGVLAAGSLASMSGCVAAVAAGGIGGGLLLSDRRSSGAQIDDGAIELKAGPRIRDAIGDRGHVNVTSYNRVVLLTGEVPNEADKAAVAKAVGGIDNVASVVNELAISGNSSLSSRSSDALITTRVKAVLIDTKSLPAASIKVVTERGIVYLMGRVTQQEADHAANVVRDIGGVLKVVRVFEILSDEQLKALTAH